MAYFGSFCLDSEKDMIVTLDKEGEKVSFILETPNHNTGNLIRNFASLCSLPLRTNEKGLIEAYGNVPAYVDINNRLIYIFRLGNTKVANIYPDGSVEMKANVSAIAKTLMSQTKDYRIDISKTIFKTFILQDNKFRSDLHTHMNGNLRPEILIAMGIVHQIRYPLYYVKKLNLKLTSHQQKALMRQRTEVEQSIDTGDLKGKYKDRRIDDHTFINFADLLLNNPENMSENIARIRISLAIMKDGQAVFTNLEKVYLYRYVFTKGKESQERIALRNIDAIADEEIRAIVEAIDREGVAVCADDIIDQWLAVELIVAEHLEVGEDVDVGQA